MKRSAAKCSWIVIGAILLLALTAGCRSEHERALADAKLRIGGDPERGAFLM
jgi:hypothetical protein